LDVETIAVELGCEPLHFGTVSAGFFGDDYVRARSVTGDGGKPAHDAFSAAEHWELQRGIGLVQPRGEADSARDAVEFDDAEAGVGEEDVGTDDARHIVLKGRVALEIDEVLRFAAVKPIRNPGGLFACGALAVKQIDGTIKLEQEAAKGLEFTGNFFAEWKRRSGHAPVLVLEETARFPQPGETGWKGLEMILKELGVLERFASLDTESLSRALLDPGTDRYLKAALEKFARIEKTRRLRLVPKGNRQLDLFN